MAGSFEDVYSSDSHKRIHVNELADILCFFSHVK